MDKESKSRVEAEKTSFCVFLELVCKCLSNRVHVTLVIQVGCDVEMGLLCILSLLHLNALNHKYCILPWTSTVQCKNVPYFCRKMFITVF